ncbi:hypothetical protein [Methyloglobulus sp.]|uniref:hypothetical protein n=1 Tax=Methyloglobulus sp. TaxID=2518622 RepID=UPI003988D5DD
MPCPTEECHFQKKRQDVCTVASCHVIVKGGDYRPEQVAGGDCKSKAGGEVKILPFVEGQSTTAIVTKAKGL